MSAWPKKWRWAIGGALLGLTAAATNFSSSTSSNLRDWSNSDQVTSNLVMLLTVTVLPALIGYWLGGSKTR